MTGWVKLPRRIEDWEWYTDVNTCRLFTHLFMKANYEPGRWKGHEIKRGQLITTFRDLIVETGLSFQNIRTALDHLESTDDIIVKTIFSTSKKKSSLITICNYNKWQSTEDGANKQEDENEKLNNEKVRKPTNGKQEREIDKAKRIKHLEDFDTARKIYPGKKRGLDTMFKVFIKHEDWKEVLPLLLPAIEEQIKYRISEADNPKIFLAPWKNLQTWLNKRSWEDEETNPTINKTPEPIKQDVSTNSLFEIKPSK